MRNLQFVALMLLSAISIGPSLFGSNSRSLASQDCINCEVSHSSNSEEIEENIKKLNKSLPSLSKNEQILSSLKEKNKCGENDFASATKSKGRLKKDQRFFVQNDPMYSEVEDAQFIFGMNLPKEGRLPSAREEKPYIGKSFQNDLVMIEEVYNGRNIVGFNVTISLCSVENKKKELISNDRELVGLAFRGVSLDSDDTCGLFNDIDMANFTMVSKKKSLFGSNLPFEKTITALDCDL